MSRTINSLFAANFPVKYVRVSIHFGTDRSMSMMMPIDFTTTAQQLTQETCLLFSRKFGIAMQPNSHSLFLVETTPTEKTESGDVKLSEIATDTVLSLIPRVAAALRNASLVELALLGTHVNQPQVTHSPKTLSFSGSIPPYESSLRDRQNDELLSRMRQLEIQLRESQQQVDSLSSRLEHSFDPTRRFDDFPNLGQWPPVVVMQSSPDPVKPRASHNKLGDFLTSPPRDDRVTESLPVAAGDSPAVQNPSVVTTDTSSVIARAWSRETNGASRAVVFVHPLLDPIGQSAPPQFFESVV